MSDLHSCLGRAFTIWPGNLSRSASPQNRASRLRWTVISIASSGSNRHVVVELKGGLGNQMFQYAIGRAIAEAQGRRLLLDDVLALRANRGSARKRSYGLHIFNIDAQLISTVGLTLPGTWARIVQQHRGFHPEVLEETPFALVYLSGFWQNEKYFRASQDRIRKDFSFSLAAPAGGSSWESRIRDSSSPVCLHVRRQEYVTGEGGGVRFGFAGGGYYERAVRQICSRIPDAHFFVFSDDIPWCRQNLEIAGPHAFVCSEGTPDEQAGKDFGLMTLCDHFIIANSSFSWWAAWLGGSPQKIVIAPELWFRDVPSDSRDIAPAGWLRL